MSHPPFAPAHPRRARLLLLLALLAWPVTRPAVAEESAPLAANLAQALNLAIRDDRLPGALIHHQAPGSTVRLVQGRHSLEPSESWLEESAIFDLASLTKVVATATSIMILEERGLLDLQSPVSTYLEGYLDHGREHVTVLHLITHLSGLPPGIPRRETLVDYPSGIRLAMAEVPREAPGATLRYSDINYILLGEIVRVVSGRPLDEFSRDEIFRPLGMSDTGFRPSPACLPRVVPTQRSGEGFLHGVVHDPTARAMGGVAGHAGLFSTAHDLSRFARMILNEGELEGTRILKAETVRRMSSRHTPEGIRPPRAIGWVLHESEAGPPSIGHTGWTGTAIRLDPARQEFWLLLSSRTHPDGSGRTGPLIQAIADATRPNP